MGQPVTTRSFKKLSLEASGCLRECFKCTDWSVLLESQDNNIDVDNDSRMDTIRDYISFCRHAVAPVRNTWLLSQ